MQENNNLETPKDQEKPKESVFVKPSYEEMPTQFVDFKLPPQIEVVFKKMHGNIIPKKIKTMFWLESVQFNDNDYNYIQSLKPERQEYESRDQYHNRLKLQKYLTKYRSNINSIYQKEETVIQHF